MSLRRVAAWCLLAIVWSAIDGVAQPIGTFRWQTQPYCNVITLNVTQQAGIYTLDGTDDGCGESQNASALGIAFPNANGTVGFGLTIVLPGGAPLHLEATINLSTLSGTWRDSSGNNGTFVYTPGAGGSGAPRPAPTSTLAPGSITSVHIASGAVGAAQLAANAVASANVIDGAVTGADLAAGAVGATQLAANSVASSNIIDGSVTAADMAAAPRAAATAGDLVGLLTASNFVVRSVTINASAAGQVVVTASGFFAFLNSTTVDEARCAISQTSALDDVYAVWAGEKTADAIAYAPFASTRAFDVAAGSQTFNLVCNRMAGEAWVVRPQLTAIYVP